MKKKIRQIKDLLYNDNELLLFQDPDLYPYPTIEGSSDNFLSYYEDYGTDLDAYFVKEYGDRYVEYDVETDTDFLDAWQQDLYSTVLVYLDAWARLYYALNINYNPVYNVEEHTETIYGQHVTDNEIGARQHTKGQQQNTKGSETDTSTTSAVSIDAVQEKETGKQTDVYGQRSDTEGQRIDSDLAAKDTTTSKQHTDTVNRSGNIGVVSATELLNQEIAQKKRLSFFRNVFLVLVEEVGAFYEPDFLQ